MSEPTEPGERLSGGCACGAVRFECARAVRPPALCHCRDCRRYVGAHVVGWCTVTRREAHFTGAALRAFRSSPRVTRTFCGKCGTSLTWSHDDYPDLLDITLASFDAADRLAPADHIWLRDALPWDQPHDGLPEHAAERDSWERLTR
jgi:hypothetical protein